MLQTAHVLDDPPHFRVYLISFSGNSCALILPRFGDQKIKFRDCFEPLNLAG